MPLLGAGVAATLPSAVVSPGAAVVGVVDDFGSAPVRDVA